MLRPGDTPFGEAAMALLSMPARIVVENSNDIDFSLIVREYVDDRYTITQNTVESVYAISIPTHLKPSAFVCDVVIEYPRGSNKKYYITRLVDNPSSGFTEGYMNAH